MQNIERKKNVFHTKTRSFGDGVHAAAHFFQIQSKDLHPRQDHQSQNPTAMKNFSNAVFNNDFNNYQTFEDAKRVNEIASELVQRKIEELESKKKQIQSI